MDGSFNHLVADGHLRCRPLCLTPDNQRIRWLTTCAIRSIPHAGVGGGVLCSAGGLQEKPTLGGGGVERE
jgi:hypothetical protein